MPTIAEYLKYCSKIAKLKDNIILLLLGVKVTALYDTIYGQLHIHANLNEVYQVIFSILYGKIKKM